MIREKFGKLAAFAAFASVQLPAFAGSMEGDFKNPPPDARAEALTLEQWLRLSAAWAEALRQ